MTTYVFTFTELSGKHQDQIDALNEQVALSRLKQVYTNTWAWGWHCIYRINKGERT